MVSNQIKQSSLAWLHAKRIIYRVRSTQSIALISKTKPNLDKIHRLKYQEVFQKAKKLLRARKQSRKSYMQKYTNLLLWQEMDRPRSFYRAIKTQSIDGKSKLLRRSIT